MHFYPVTHWSRFQKQLRIDKDINQGSNQCIPETARKIIGTASSLSLPPTEIKSALKRSDSEGANKTKPVRFHTTSKVVLIPTRNELREAGLTPKMYWEATDYAKSKSDARLEFLFALVCQELRKEELSKHRAAKSIVNNPRP